MRILLLTQWFDPEPIFKGLPFAKELVKLGHEVEVLTAFPNYPGGKVYDGYRIRPFQREVMAGIKVTRVMLYPSHDKSGLRRMANYVSFAVSAVVLGLFLIKPADIMYVYHPPATIGFPAVIFHLLRRMPFVYDIQDLWPDTLVSTGMLNNKFLLTAVNQWCKFVYRQASRITVLSPGFKKRLVARGVPEDKIEVIYNWCDDSEIKSVEGDEKLAKELGMAEKFNVVFAGTMGIPQKLATVLEAARIIEKKYPVVQFVFVGGGVDVSRLQQKAKEMQLSNVLFLPRMPMSEIGKVLSLADVLLVHLKEDPLFEITIPSKTQAYMAAGRPIIMGVRGDSAKLVERAGAGYACIPEDSYSIAAVVEKMFLLPREQLEAMGEAGRVYYERELALSVGVRKFEAIFRSVIGDGSF
ncbi:glycosyltransferase family 4 protein [candidate division NPL-UPA2 bacterium]|nr:glycosyltransferase family 4 protein [candidate division NPL-UPA2 bacterium]